MSKDEKEAAGSSDKEVSGERGEQTSKPKRSGKGSTLRPVYGERRPMMYHLFETEMQGISGFNGEALRYFSFGAFLASLFLNIAITAYFVPNLTQAQDLVVRWGLTAAGALAVLCFGFGVWTVYSKKTLIAQIKKETRSDANTI